VFEELAKKQGATVEAVAMEGDPASKIVGYADKGGFDMIVMGSRGLGRFKEMMLGSVSSKVLHHAKCSVLIVK
jgi:nucleotide-binding universal stress UspA family protein